MAKHHLAAADKEREILRQEQADAVMPFIGPLLDAWEGTPNDEKDSASPLHRAIEAISQAVERGVE